MEKTYKRITCEVIYEEFQVGDLFTCADVASKLALSRNRISAALACLEKDGVVKAVGRRPRSLRGGRSWVVFRLEERKELEWRAPPRKIGPVARLPGYHCQFRALPYLDAPEAGAAPSEPKSPRPAVEASLEPKAVALGPPWMGCGECDCSFPCSNGGARCIRVPAPSLTDRLLELAIEAEGLKPLASYTDAELWAELRRRGSHVRAA